MGPINRRRCATALLEHRERLTCTRRPGAGTDGAVELPISASPRPGSAAPAPRTPARERAPLSVRARPRLRLRLTTDVSTGEVTVGSVRHRPGHHHRRVDDRHHRDRHRAFAGPDAAGRAGARARHPGPQPVRQRQRRADRRRHARLRRDRASNTLVLINGRRLNDVDIAGVDFSAIPRESIERIEITRGNSGAVLYGDGAVGGVINIVTKTGVGLPPSVRVAGSFGSFGYGEGNARPRRVGPVGRLGLRQRHQLGRLSRQQRLRQQNAVGDLRYTDGPSSAYFNLSGDDQHLGLPGGRLVTPTSSQVDHRPARRRDPVRLLRQAGRQRHRRCHAFLAPGTELIVDGGVRQKNQQAGFFSAFGALFDSGVEATLTTASLTPRLVSQHDLGGAPGKLLAGVDFYDSVYGSDRGLHRGDPPIHHYDLHQHTAGYSRKPSGCVPTPTLASARACSNSVSRRATRSIRTRRAGSSRRRRACRSTRARPSTPGTSALSTGSPSALRCSRARRGASGCPTSTSGSAWRRSARRPISICGRRPRMTIEGGFRVRYGGFELQSSVYFMELQDEIFFSPATFTNINLDPTRRYGVETIATWQATHTLLFKAASPIRARSSRRAVRRQRRAARLALDGQRRRVLGHLPEVARVRCRRPLLRPAPHGQRLGERAAADSRHTLVDVRIGGRYDQFFWAFSVQNVFDVHYFEYAISALDFLTGLPSVGTYNAYPLPGRTFLAKAGVKW